MHRRLALPRPGVKRLSRVPLWAELLDDVLGLPHLAVHHLLIAQKRSEVMFLGVLLVLLVEAYLHVGLLCKSGLNHVLLSLARVAH